ncbi:acetolactate synthase large subunit [Ramlibacter aurantiacus]|nr:acetolactate synthase large subunit [Ramlibacter aurantiacus]
MTTGAHALLDALHAQGVAVCFANPGTTELDLVRAAEEGTGMRFVLGMQENVCTGAADGWGRMSGRPAATLLHLGPGLANGIANLHNARRARTPVVNVVGDHTSWHLPYDAPLASDIDSLARPVSAWVHRIDRPADAAPAAREAVRQAVMGGGVATLIFPADHQAASTPADAPVPTAEAGMPPPSAWDPAGVDRALRASRRPLFLLGGVGEHGALSARGQRAVARLLSVTGGTAYAETFPARAERGGGLPAFDRLPYFPEPARAALDAADLVVRVGALPPITYFGYQGHPSELVGADRLLCVCEPGEDAATRLEELADRMEAPPYLEPALSLPPVEPGALTPPRIAATVAAALPEGAIVSVEGGTCGYPFYAASAGAARHTTLTNTGGAIGQGLPVALGAALACPGRPVIALLSDGSTQYTVQTLWTLAHEGLPVVALIAANHQYAILRNELRRGGELGPRAQALTSLDAPRVDWVSLARGYGVAATRAATTAELDAQLRAALATRAPALIEMSL